MYRRLVLPVTALAALVSLFVVVLPAGAKAGSGSGGAWYFGEEVTITEPVAGDLVVVGGTVAFDGRGRVEGDLIHAGSTIIGAEGRVAGRIQSLASLEGAAGALTKTAIVASLLVAWLIVAVVVAMISGRELRLSSVEVRTSALHCFVLGLVAITSFVLTAIAFSYLVPYVIGIPLLAALGAFAILTKVYGMIAVFHAVGTAVAGARNRDQLAKRKWFRGDVAMVVVGVLLLGAVRLVPVVGPIVWSLASIFGVGVALATKFGRREPWFLEYRTANA